MIKKITVSTAAVFFLLMFGIFGIGAEEIGWGVFAGVLGGACVVIGFPILFYMLEQHFRAIGFPLDEQERKHKNGL